IIQAEDGIRDFHVTGVQTCALPISGKVQNRGLEAMLYVSPIKTKNFQWKTTFTYTKNKNEILELAAGVEGGEEQVLATSGTVSRSEERRVGKRVGMMWKRNIINKR